MSIKGMTIERLEEIEEDTAVEGLDRDTAISTIRELAAEVRRLRDLVPPPTKKAPKITRTEKAERLILAVTRTGKGLLSWASSRGAAAVQQFGDFKAALERAEHHIRETEEEQRAEQ